MEWQPVRIAPVVQWDEAHPFKADHDFKGVGKVVRVRQIGIRLSGLGCESMAYEVHPDDVPSIADAPIPSGRCLVCEHQIQCD